MDGKEIKKFDPNEHRDGTKEAFKDFVEEFEYSYDSLNRYPPKTITTDDAIKAWVKQDMRKVFLGRFSHRNLQKLYEDVTSATERAKMTFEDMRTKFEQSFELSRNTTLANFKFRQIAQGEDETFDIFCIRVKNEAKGCSFKCTSETCTVPDTMIRDQILIGTSNDEIRKEALTNQWNLTDLITKGRSIEASRKNAATIKKEEEMSAHRTSGKPGRYSRKYRQRQRLEEDNHTKRSEDRHRNSNRRKDETRRKSERKYSSRKCKFCSAFDCKGGSRCPGKTAGCFACGKRGHYRGSFACPKTVNQVSGQSSESEQDVSPPSSDEEYSRSETGSEDDSDDQQGSTRRLKKVMSCIPKVRIVGGRRVANIRRSKRDYHVMVTIKEKAIKVFADTGADITVMSAKVARGIGLELDKTRMKIRPYGSKALKCIGKYVGTVTYGEGVANAIIYVVNSQVETLLSGPLCEELGILSFHGNNIRKAEAEAKDLPPETSQLVTEFPRLFDGVGLMKNYKVKMHIDPSVKPVAEPPRPIPFHVQEKLERELKKMEDQDIIEPHTGPAPWISNLVLAPKEVGLRVVLDMRKPNKAIKSTNLPIPRPEYISSRLAGYRLYSKLDLTSAFHQLELDEEAKALTVFHAGGRLMRYKRLIMGCSPSSGELNAALQPIFRDFRDIHVIQDDIIVAGRNKKEHDANLKSACQTLMDAGLTLNPGKCIIAKESVPWWGMIISSKGLSPDPAKVKAVKEMQIPKTKDELKSWFCMIQSKGYGKDFIRNLAAKTQNIRQLLKKHAKFTWSKECHEEFEKIREEFSEKILMAHYNPKLKTLIEVDASYKGISAILSQKDDSGKKHIVAVSSRATTPAESRYAQLDLEAMAIDHGLRRYRFYIVGSPEITVVTDHKPLESIFNNVRKGSMRTDRIKLRHQDIRYKIKWEKGENNIADYLSRHPCPWEKLNKEVKEEAKEFEKTVWFLQFNQYTEAMSIKTLIEETSKDLLLSKLKKAIRRGYIDPEDEQLRHFKALDELTLMESGLVLKKEKIVLPRKLVKLAITKAHQGSHAGISALKRRIRTHFYHPKLDETVKEFVKNCKACAMFNPVLKKNTLYPAQVNQLSAWEMISVDLFGPLPDKRHILVAQDMMSKFPAAKIINKTDTATITETLKEFYDAYGTPATHRTDNGPPFNSKGFVEFSKRQGINHTTSFPYHPQANPVECFMKPLGKAMKVAHHAKKSMRKALGEFLSTYRATPHSATGLAPGDILFRHGYAKDFPRLNGIVEEEVEAALEDDFRKRQARDKIKNSGRKEPNLEVGEKVLVKDQTRKSKFDPIFLEEPRTIMDLEPGGGVICQTEDGNTQRRHVDDVRPAPAPEQIQSNQPEGTETQGTSETIQTDTTETDIPLGPRRSERGHKPNPKYIQ